MKFQWPKTIEIVVLNINILFSTICLNNTRKQQRAASCGLRAAGCVPVVEWGQSQLGFTALLIHVPEPNIMPYRKSAPVLPPSPPNPITRLVVVSGARYIAKICCDANGKAMKRLSAPLAVSLTHIYIDKRTHTHTHTDCAICTACACAIKKPPERQRARHLLECDKINRRIYAVPRRINNIFNRLEDPLMLWREPPRRAPLTVARTSSRRVNSTEYIHSHAANTHVRTHARTQSRRPHTA